MKVRSVRVGFFFLLVGIVVLTCCREKKGTRTPILESPVPSHTETQSAGDTVKTETRVGTIFKKADDGSYTPPIDGSTAIASLESGQLGGAKQWITIRGRDSSNPVLLWLHGGPGLTEIPFVSIHQELETHFVVVNWDQRGAGKSHNALNPCGGMSIDRFVEDAYELALYLKERFEKDRIFVLGHSWGATIGILLIHRYPQLFQAFVSVGQPVNNHREEKISLDFVLHTAKQQGVKEAQRELEGISYPYRSRDELLVQRKWLLDFGGMIWKKRELLDCVFRPKGCYPVPEYKPQDWVKRAQGLSTSYGCLSEEMESFDLFRMVEKVEVPVYFFLGAHDYQVPFKASVEYFEGLDAPHKEIVWFRESAHYPQLEETQRFHSMVIEKLLKGER